MQIHGSGTGNWSNTAIVTDEGKLLVDPGSLRQIETWTVTNERGNFNFSGVSFTGSFTGSNIITPGTGSSLFLKGFNASAEIATQFSLVFSGGNKIGTFNIPNSGTIAMNLIGMEPSGATNQPIMVEMNNAGSLHLTVYTMDSL